MSTRAGFSWNHRLGLCIHHMFPAGIELNVLEIASGSKMQSPCRDVLGTRLLCITACCEGRLLLDTYRIWEAMTTLTNVGHAMESFSFKCCATNPTMSASARINTAIQRLRVTHHGLHSQPLHSLLISTLTRNDMIHNRNLPFSYSRSMHDDPPEWQSRETHRRPT